jgi:6-pyruvoyltetrahydropterin/6-carboxytetrahydropterin synthase
MYLIAVEKDFDAAHFLRGYGGRCEQLHGHRFRVVARIRADKLNKTGMAYDFTEFKKLLGAVLEKYDHHCLDEVKPFDKINPSSENIAETVFKELKKKLPRSVALDSVDVWESPDACATFKPGKL